MATWKKVVVSGSAPELASVTLDTDLAIAHGGTGASTAAAARTALGVAIGSDVQAFDAQLADIAGLSPANSSFIVGDGSNFVAESGATVRTSLGVGTGDAVEFASIKTSGNVSGSVTSTGSFGMLVGDGSGITNLTSAAISTYNTSGDNRIITSVNGNTVQGESSLTFDGSTLAVTGDQTVSGTIKDMAKVSGSAVSSASFGRIDATTFHGDGSGLTGVTQDIDSLSELAATPHATQDEYLISDNGTEKRISVTNAANGAFALISGDATVAAGGALTIANSAVSDAMLEGSITDAKLNQITTAGKVALGALEIDGASEMGAALVDADLFIVDDGANGTEKSMLASRLPTYLFGKVSGDATINGSGALTIGANAIQTGMVHDDVATELAGAGMTDSSGVLNVIGGDGITASANEIEVTVDDSTVGLNNTNGAGAVYVKNSGIGVTQIAAGVAGTGLSGGAGTALAVDFTELTAAQPTFTGLTITGDLTVQGTTTTLDTQNLLVEDNFIFAGTGSAGNAWDGGLIVQSGSADKSGSAIFSDSSAHRWAVAKGVQASGSNTVTPEAFVATVNINQATPPGSTSGSYGEGEMYITATDDIWIRVG